MNPLLLVREVGEVAIGMQDGLLFHLVVGEDGLVFDEERVSVGDCLVLGDIVELEGHAVGALVQHGMTVEEFGGNQVLDYFAIPHPLPKLIIIINKAILHFTGSQCNGTQAGQNGKDASLFRMFSCNSKMEFGWG